MAPTDADIAAAAAVATVLRAPDHYAAIGGPRSATLADLRQCYVRASLRVHPDKNSHPDATRAFQRVAAAWRELGDEKSRWRYDQQLSMGYGDGDDMGVHGCDAEEAFAAFARATAACGGGGPFGDCADSLLFAQQMAQAQARMQHNGMPGMMGQPGMPGMMGQPPQQSLQSCASGVAYSTGLWVAGVATSAAGFNTIGNFMRRVAVVQGFGQVAIGGLTAYQDPDIRRAIEANAFLISVNERAAPVKVALANAGSAVRHKVEDIAASEIVEQLGSTLGSMPSCLPRRRLAGAPAEALSREVLRVPGTRVTLAGLQGTAELNGRLCEVVRFDSQRERYVVRLLPLGVSVFSGIDEPVVGKDGGGHDRGRRVDNMKLVKMDNLRLAAPIPADRAPKSPTQFV